MKKCHFFQIFSFDPLIKILISIVGTSNLVQNAPLTLSYPHRNFQGVIGFSKFFQKIKSQKKNSPAGQKQNQQKNSTLKKISKKRKKNTFNLRHKSQKTF